MDVTQREVDAAIMNSSSQKFLNRLSSHLLMPPYNHSSWKTPVQNLDAEKQCKFGRSSSSQISTVEKSLGVFLPNQLKEILSETDGIEAEYAAARGLIWPLDTIEKQNREFRTIAAFKELYMPFDNLLFFGDDGGGDQFAYAITDGSVRKKDIFRWEHETDARSWFAMDLERFFEHRLKNTE